MSSVLRRAAAFSLHSSAAVSYAIVRVGGKQYRVEEGDSILVDRMRADEGDRVDLEPLLFADGDKSVLDSGDLGKVKIQAVVTGHEKGKKIHGLKFKPKRGYKRRYGRDSNAKRLGVKVFAGQAVTGGEIIVRQRGTRFKPGDGVGIGKDDTIFAKSAGIVQFREGRRGRVISVEQPPGDAA